MKVQIRRGCFETNSSSTHAICISKDDVDKSNLPKHITFTHGEFGWEEAILSDVWSRASYLYQAICDCYYEEERQEKLGVLEDLLAGYGISCEFEPDKKDSWGLTYGYIDHSYEAKDFVDAVLNDSDKLIRYLFGDSIIVTGNDNSEWFDEYMYGTTDEYMYGTTDEYKDEFSKYEIFEKGN